MRCKPVTVRIALLCANMLLAALLVGSYVSGVWWPEPASQATARIGLSKPREAAPIDVGGLSLAVAQRLMPESPPVAKRPPSPDPRPTDPPPPPAPGGPLAEQGWAYGWGVISRDDPGDTRVLLSRRSAPLADAHRPGRRPRPAIRRRKPPEQVAFFMREKTIRDETRDLAFIAVSADADAFVYCLPDAPKIHYTLSRVRKGRWEDSARWQLASHRRP